jgi:hypothetical protein
MRTAPRQRIASAIPDATTPAAAAIDPQARPASPTRQSGPAVPALRATKLSGDRAIAISRPLEAPGPATSLTRTQPTG